MREATLPDSTGATDARSVPPSIRELIAEYQARTGDSLYDIERRSVISGHEVSQKYLWRVTAGQTKAFPKYVETFSAIAAGIETTETAVVLGYAVELGIPVRASRFATQVPYALDDAPEHLREALLVMARAITDPANRHARRPADALPDMTGASDVIEDEGGERLNGAEGQQ